MKTIWAKTALLPSGWASDVRVDLREDGRIASVTKGADAVGDRVGILLPAPVNSHSHAFQRAMAGLSEARGPGGNDSFWTWRKLMYAFLDRLDPDQVQAIAALVQMEMLEAGYAANVEFHYLHHQPGGLPYDRLAELSERIVAAADQTGVGLTLLPVAYQFGGLDGRALGPAQVRFGNDPDQFAQLYGQAKSAIDAHHADAHLGLAPHSLRAVAPADLNDLAALTDGPLHMHLAEQVAEVDEVQAALGARPVEYVLGNLEINARWCLIHCTQMQPHETAGLAQSGAVAGLCPITESSLGDGIFDGVRWLENSGAISVGSDSNIRISLAEELRTLEYSQRLRDKGRAMLASAEKSTGRRLFDGICAGGAQAAGRDTGAIAPGKWADLLALDAEHIDFQGRCGDTLLDTFIFAEARDMVCDVWAAGRHVVQDGRHIARAVITKNYAQAMERLTQDL